MTVVERGAHGPESRGLGAWLAKIAPRQARGELTVAIVPDADVRALNRRFRRIDKGTDVLSFAAGTAGEGRRQRAQGSGQRAKGGGLRAEGKGYLGDVVISRGIARKQAKMMGHTVRTELRVLALHGLLHLLGYDHEADGGRMARVEGRLRRKGGLPLGLIARST